MIRNTTDQANKESKTMKRMQVRAVVYLDKVVLFKKNEEEKMREFTQELDQGIVEYQIIANVRKAV